MNSFPNSTIEMFYNGLFHRKAKNSNCKTLWLLQQRILYLTGNCLFILQSESFATGWSVRGKIKFSARPSQNLLFRIGKNRSCAFFMKLKLGLMKHVKIVIVSLFVLFLKKKTVNFLMEEIEVWTGPDIIFFCRFGPEREWLYFPDRVVPTFHLCEWMWK